MTDTDYLQEINALFPDSPPIKLISEYVQNRRILPPSTPFPGLWDNSKTVYLVEIMDNCSPYSPVQRTIVVKGAQIGMTAAAENVIGFYMDESPAEILYVSATQELLEKWANKRLEPMITSLGFRHKISMTEVLDNAKSRRSGDKTFSKQYIGGALDMASAQSASSLRSDSKRLLVRDEIDGAPENLKTGEGNWLEVSKARTNAWGARAKILDLSTPKTFDDSNIWKAFLEGDQRKWIMKCPHCGAEQSFSWTMEEFAEHMIADVDDEGRIIAASVICIGCKKEIPESKKREMINTGRWIPTTVPARPNIRSYHIPTAISLMMSWVDLYLEFDKVLKYEGRDEATPRSFTNLYLGLPFKESGTRPKIDNPSDRVGDYDRGTIPEGVIYLTMAVDVQPGKKNPRLEMEILGVGLGYRTWSIDYKIFEGSVDHPEDGAWVDFHNWIMNESQFTDQWGRKFRPVIGFVDAGDGNMMETVYQFCAAHKGLFPSKGQQTIRASHEKKDSGDDPLRNEMKYGFTRIGQSDRFLYRISTNHYKRIIYANLQVERVEGDGAQRAHFCDFPREYGHEYFDGLLSEELRADGAYYKIHTRNEPLDCRVYSLAASDVWLDDQVRRAQEAWKKQHPETTKDDLMKINGWQALEHLKRILDSQIVSRR